MTHRSKKNQKSQPISHLFFVTLHRIFAFLKTVSFSSFHVESKSVVLKHLSSFLSNKKNYTRLWNISV